MKSMLNMNKNTTNNNETNNSISNSNSWDLKINVDEFNIFEKKIRVNGEMHIGRVIFSLVEQLDSMKNDWSGFSLWWPSRNQWLNKSKWTLDQYGVQADAVLHFNRIRKKIRLIMPDQQVVKMSVDFSVNVFSMVKSVCKQLDIRHTEELSISRANSKMVEFFEGKASPSSALLSDSSSKTNNKNHHQQHHHFLKENVDSISTTSSASTLNNSSSINSDKSLIILNNNINNGMHSSSSYASNNRRERSTSKSADYMMQYVLHLSPVLPTQDYLSNIEIKYKNILDKTFANSRWLDSSRSLMEQNIRENDLVLLKFKYFNFFDLNLALDCVRINQIYEQAKWSILSEELDCTEQELIYFAALQLHIQLQSKKSYMTLLSSSNNIHINSDNNNAATITATTAKESSSCSNQNDAFIKLSSINDEDDVDTALNKLEKEIDMMHVSSESNHHEQNHNSNNKDETSDDNNKCSLNQDMSAAAASLSMFNDQEFLAEQLFLLKPQRLTFKKYKSYYFVLYSTNYLSYYKSREDSMGKPIDKLNLKGCEIVPEVNLESRKFSLTLRMPMIGGLNEINLRFPNEGSYARWTSACKLASKNKLSLNDQLVYQNEVNSILSLLKLKQVAAAQHQQSSSSIMLEISSPQCIENRNLSDNNNHQIMNSVSLTSFKSATNNETLRSADRDLNYQNQSSSKQLLLNDNFELHASNLLPGRMIKKYKAKQWNDRVLEYYSRISDLNLNEAKMKYIKHWQELPDYGITYFAARIKGSRYKEEVIGISSTRLVRKNFDGQLVKSWRLNTMKTWSVNWDIKQFEMIFDDEQLMFTCLNCDTKIVHEFIGGYIYLSLRKDHDSLDEEMFFKLTEQR